MAPARVQFPRDPPTCPERLTTLCGVRWRAACGCRLRNASLKPPSRADRGAMGKGQNYCRASLRDGGSAPEARRAQVLKVRARRSRVVRLRCRRRAGRVQKRHSEAPVRKWKGYFAWSTCASAAGLVSGSRAYSRIFRYNVPRLISSSRAASFLFHPVDSSAR